MSPILRAAHLQEKWPSATLRWVAEIYAGGTPDRSNLSYWTDGEVPWLNSGSVNQGVIKRPSDLISQEAYDHSSAKWIPRHSVVIALAGQGKTKGMAARLEIESTCNQSMAAIVPGPELEYRYLHYWLLANYQNIRNMAGGDKRDGLNLEHIGDIKLPLPFFPEQQAIADYLDRETAQIDELVTEQRALIELLRERRFAEVYQAVHADALTVQPVGGQVVNDEKLPSTWCSVPLRRLIEIRNGRDYRSVEVDEGGYPVYGSGGEFRRSGEYLHDGESVLFGRKGTVDRPLFVTGKFWTVDTMFYTVSDDRTCTKFVYYCALTIPYSYYVTSTAIPSMTQEDLRSHIIAIPSLKEQVRITRYLDSKTALIDELIAESEDLIALSLERRSALITAAVTGQIDVCEAS